MIRPATEYRELCLVTHAPRDVPHEARDINGQSAAGASEDSYSDEDPATTAEELFRLRLACSEYAHTRDSFQHKRLEGARDREDQGILPTKSLTQGQSLTFVADTCIAANFSRSVSSFKRCSAHDRNRSTRRAWHRYTQHTETERGQEGTRVRGGGGGETERLVIQEQKKGMEGETRKKVGEMRIDNAARKDEGKKRRR